MSATTYEPGRVPSAQRVDEDWLAARRRLTLAVLWLAGLIGWGLFSYLADQPRQPEANGGIAAAGQVFDGRGKWAGY
jgi:hypothetical protein